MAAQHIPSGDGIGHRCAIGQADQSANIISIVDVVNGTDITCGRGVGDAAGIAERGAVELNIARVDDDGAAEGVRGIVEEEIAGAIFGEAVGSAEQGGDVCKLA
jgi:hypothetical protein